MSRISQDLRNQAAQAHGLVDRGTAGTFGADDNVIHAQTTANQWDTVHAGVYRLNVTPITWRERVYAAVLAAGPGSAVSHRAAMLLWGLDGVSSAPVEVTVPHSHGPVPDHVIVHRSRRPIPIIDVDRIPCTTVERTLLDLSASLPPRLLEKATLSALYNKLTNYDRLWDGLARFGGRGVGGTRRFRAILRGIDPESVPRSNAEIDMAHIVDSADVPRPVLQFEVRLRSGTTAFIDFAWPDRRKFVEVDSMLAHSTPDQLDRDLERQNMILELGYELRRFTARQIRDRPSEVKAELQRFINS